MKTTIKLYFFPTNFNYINFENFENNDVPQINPPLVPLPIQQPILLVLLNVQPQVPISPTPPNIPSLRETP